MEDKDGVGRAQVRLETMCGKGHADGESLVPRNIVHNALLDEKLLDPSTRELVVFLRAQQARAAHLGP